MAKKSSSQAASSSSRAPSAKLKERDARTREKIVNLAAKVSKTAISGKDPQFEIPTRAKSNTLWNKKRGILEMGDAKAERPLFDLKTAKQFMQTMLHASTIKDLIEAEKTSSLRGVFYKAKHTVAGTRELIPHPSYRVVYQVEGEAVWVLAVVHTARQWPPPRR